ncbi:Hypothetical protein SMAX5B_001817 [Scophthalmus maximus]|uniref:THAP-type domain-containing protein n=1 Tax=Scophthalmus maximus TaxID=52904 RepID=A0A2U9BPY4_SCOMX|nr:Hypothetical protein SMAX5B_001817 [Scophthalmus maximus]
MVKTLNSGLRTGSSQTNGLHALGFVTYFRFRIILLVCFTSVTQENVQNRTSFKRVSDPSRPGPRRRRLVNTPRDHFSAASHAKVCSRHFATDDETEPLLSRTGNSRAAVSGTRKRLCK